MDILRQLVSLDIESFDSAHQKYKVYRFYYPKFGVKQFHVKCHLLPSFPINWFFCLFLLHNIHAATHNIIEIPTKPQARIQIPAIIKEVIQSANKSSYPNSTTDKKC